MFKSQKEEGIFYHLQKGAYAIIFKENKVLLVEAKTGFFLPGGTLEEEELPIDALKRELLEEASIKISNAIFLEEREFYGLSQVKKEYKHLVSEFYLVTDFQMVSRNDELKSTFIDIEDALKRITLEHQMEALLNAWRKYGRL